ncbi:hypothetical protein QTP88_013597 [Uroleucon formosanum]
MFRIRRRWPKSNRCPDDSGEPVRRGGGGGGDDGVMRWTERARAQARVAVVRDVKIVRRKIFSGSSNRIGSGNPGGGVRDDARPSTNGHEWKFLRIFFIIFVQTTRRPAERYDNIMSIYVYNVIPARVC